MQKSFEGISSVQPHQPESIIHHLQPMRFDYVIKKTSLNQANRLNHREMGQLSWVENDHIASLAGRIAFINQLIDKIMAMNLAKSAPLTLISLGAGGLLTEYFIHEQLSKAGFSDLSWRVIDLDYTNNGYSQCRKEFKDKVKTDVRAFTTEQTYFNKMVDQKNVADEDRKKGATIVLSIDPPTEINTSSTPAPYDTDCMLLKGRPVDDIKKANSIYFLVTQPEYKNMLLQVPEALAKGDQIVALDCALRCSLNDNGDYDLSFSPSYMGNKINQDSQPHLEQLKKTAQASRRPIELQNVTEAFDKLTEKLQQEGLSTLTLLVSDYDTSVSKLRRYTSDSHHPSLFASFEKNDMSFE